MRRRNTRSATTTSKNKPAKTREASTYDIEVQGLGASITRTRTHPDEDWSKCRPTKVAHELSRSLTHRRMVLPYFAARIIGGQLGQCLTTVTYAALKEDNEPIHADEWRRDQHKNTHPRRRAQSSQWLRLPTRVPRLTNHVSLNRELRGDTTQRSEQSTPQAIKSAKTCNLAKLVNGASQSPNKQVGKHVRKHSTTSLPDAQRRKTGMPRPVGAWEKLSKCNASARKISIHTTFLEALPDQIRTYSPQAHP